MEFLQLTYCFIVQLTNHWTIALPNHTYKLNQIGICIADQDTV